MISWRAPLRFFAAIGRVIHNLYFGKRVGVSEEVVKQRESICSNCPHNDDSMCSLCSCFIPVKVLLASEQCPDKPPRWNRVDGQ